MYLFYNLLAMFIFGTIGLFVRNAQLPSALLALIRTCIGAMILGMILLCRRKKININKGEWKYILLSACFLGCNWIFLFESYRYTSISNATIVYYSAPLMIAFASWFLYHEAFTKQKVVYLLCSMAGLVAISFQSGSFDIMGIFFGLLAACGYAGIVLTNRRIHMESLSFTFLQLSLAACIILPYVLWQKEFIQISNITMAQLPWIILLGVLHTGIAYLLYFTSIAKLSSTNVAICSYLDPCTAIILSIFILQEPCTPLQIAGIICIFAGIIGVTKSSKGDETNAL